MLSLKKPTPDANTYTRLTPFQTGKAVTLKYPEDPMCVYNHCIKQFNASCNKVASSELEYMPTSVLYRLVMGRWWTGMRADEGIVRVVFSLFLSFAVGLIPTFNILHFFTWFSVYLIYEFSARTHTQNQKLVVDPFTKMIYAPEICRKAMLMNVYFNYPAPNLDSLELPRGQLDDLIKRETQGYVMFMVYDYKFWAAYSHFDRLRYYHYANILLSAGAILLGVFKLYPALGIHEFMFLGYGYYY
mmetsp:Transcript_7156/g.13110  ORF Transcript_7156/g.13110 Transcript_7156/m.13110 type:complete len:244 (-) Transcript_7156:1261-1992(-)